MTREKKTCKILKEIRQKIAKKMTLNILPQNAIIVENV